MKQILFIICLLAATGTSTYAQAPSPASVTAPAKPIKVSKNEFKDKVKQLNELVEQNKMDETNAAWKEVNYMMIGEFRAIKTKIKEAIGTNNTADKNHYSELSANQNAIYSEVVKLKADMAANRIKMIRKLYEFASAMI